MKRLASTHSLVVCVFSLGLAMPLCAAQTTEESQAADGSWTIDPDDPLHLSVELEVGPEGVWVEHVSEFDGWLSVWVQSQEVDPALEIDVEERNEALADEDSGGGTTAVLLFEVLPGRCVAIRVSCKDGTAGEVRLHVIGSPETEATRAATGFTTTELEAIDALSEEGKFAGAREKLRGLLDSLESIPGAEQSWDVGEALLRVGWAAYDLEDWEEVVRSWGAACRCRERLFPPDHPDLLRIKGNLAVTRRELGDLTGALELKEEVLAANERLLPPDHPVLLQAQANLAVSRRELGDLAGALELEEQVLAARERLLDPDDPDLLAARVNLAMTRGELGDLPGALKLEEEILAARERLLDPDHPDLLWAKQCLAGTRRELGDLAGALELEEQVLAARERLLSADHPDLLTAMGNLAVTRERLGDRAGALELQEEVLAAFERSLPPDHPDLLTAKGNLDVVTELLEQVCAAYERLRLPDHPQLLRAKHSLAVMRKRLDDLAGALELQEEVLAAYRRLLPADHPDLLRAKGNLAVTRKELGDLEGALELQEEVHAAYERLLPADHSDLLWAKVNLAVTRGQLGDPEGLRAACVSLLESQRTVASGLAHQAPRLARSGALLALRRLERVYFCSRFCAPEDSADLDLLMAESLEALRVASVASPEVMRAARRVPELRPVLDELEEVRREAAAAAHGPATSEEGISEESVEAWRKQLVALAERRDTLEAEVRRQLDRLGVRSEPPTMEDVVASLEPGEALVSYWRYEHYEQHPQTGAYSCRSSLLAFVTTPDATVRAVELGPAAELEGLARSWRALIGEPIDRGVPPEGDAEAEVLSLGRRLREALLDRCLAILGEDRPNTLYVIPDDLVYLVPLDALPLEDGTPVGRRMPIHVAPTVRGLVDHRAIDATEGPLLALGYVDYWADGAQPESLSRPVASAPLRGDRSGSQDPWKLLVQTKYEVETVGTMYEELRDGEAVLRKGGDASKAALFELGPGARYLHIATHGWFKPEEDAVSMIDSAERESEEGPCGISIYRTQETLAGFLPETLCGLALAGANHGKDELGRVPGILTAEELATLDLSSCELAVLSACETNVGLRRAGQGIQSLQTSLHAAGVRTAITSLWEVDDAASRHLFEQFYPALWQKGLGPAEALWQAKMVLYDAGHPVRDWAAWVLTGQPD